MTAREAQFVPISLPLNTCISKVHITQIQLLYVPNNFPIDSISLKYFPNHLEVITVLKKCPQITE